MRPLCQEINYRSVIFIGHILRKNHNNECNITLSWTPEGRRKRGRPKTTWRRTIEKDRKERGWRSCVEARVAALDRDGRSVDATWQ